MLCLGFGKNRSATITIPPSTETRTIVLIGRGTKGQTSKIGIDAPPEMTVLRDNAKVKEKVGGPLAAVMKGRT